MPDLDAVVRADAEHDRVEDASGVAGDHRRRHAFKGNGPLQRQQLLGLLAGDGLLPQPDVLQRQPIVLGLKARVVVAKAVDLRDRGRKAVTGGADPGDHLLHRDEELGQERRRALDDVGIPEAQKQEADHDEQRERAQNTALGTTCATEARHAKTLTRV